MSKLKVTKNWLNWFQQNTIELVTTTDNRELFIHSIEGKFSGDQLNYETVFKLIDAFISSYDFLELEYFRLIWSEELGKKNLQFYRKGDDFLAWKKSVINSQFEIENSYTGDYEDQTEIFYNYSIDHEEDISLYKYGINDRTAIYLWYNLKNITTHYSILIEFRKSLFMIDNSFENNLPQDYIDFNNNLKETSKMKMLEKLKHS